MQKIKDILRLKYDAKLPLRQISLSLSLSLGAVSKYLKRAEAAGLGWPLPEGMSDDALRALLQPGRKVALPCPPAEPDFVEMQRPRPRIFWLFVRLRRMNVT